MNQKNIKKKKKNIIKWLKNNKYKNKIKWEQIENNIKWEEHNSLIKQRIYKKYKLVKLVDKDTWKSLHDNLVEKKKCINDCYICHSLEIKKLSKIGLITKGQKKKMKLKLNKSDHWIKKDNKINNIHYPNQKELTVVKKDCDDCKLCLIGTKGGKRAVDNLVDCTSCQSINHHWEVTHGRYKYNEKQCYYSNLICYDCFIGMYQIKKNIGIKNTKFFSTLFILFEKDIGIIADYLYENIYQIKLSELFLCKYDYYWIKNTIGPIYIYKCVLPMCFQYIYIYRCIIIL